MINRWYCQISGKISLATTQLGYIAHIFLIITQRLLVPIYLVNKYKCFKPHTLVINISNYYYY